MEIKKEKKYYDLLLKLAKTKEDKTNWSYNIGSLINVMNVVPSEAFMPIVNANKSLTKNQKTFVNKLSESKDLYLLDSIKKRLDKTL